MSDDNVTVLDHGRRLADAVREVKNAVADRDDVVVDMRDAERMRLELLANELAPVIADVPDDIDIFDFAISAGLQPRFWIDSVSHVAMGRDKRSYRFVKDTRNGRVVLAESSDLKPIAHSVTRYVAERIVERERMMQGGTPFAYRNAHAPDTVSKPASASPGAAEPSLREAKQQVSTGQTDVAGGTATNLTLSTGWAALLWGLAIFLLGGIFGFSVMATQWWEQITQRTVG